MAHRANEDRVRTSVRTWLVSQTRNSRRSTGEGAEQGNAELSKKKEAGKKTGTKAQTHGPGAKPHKH
jgi:hypothetical protein